MDPTTSPARLALRFTALSDVGRVRKDNQDSGYASGNLLVIADGVGGAARGDIASSTAVQILRRLDGPAPADMQETLAGAIFRVHDRLGELVEQDRELDGTSTTVTAALFDGTRITVGHVGDSRGYLLRDGTLSQLTKDHTFVQSLIDEGRITEEESRTHPHRNLILRAVDGVRDTEPDLFDVELAAGDRLLLCSDGCSGVLDSTRLAALLGDGSIDYAAVELVRASLEAGSTDNVTVVVADVVDGDPDRVPAVDAETSGAAVTGPMLVGAAAQQPRPRGASGAGRSSAPAADGRSRDDTGDDSGGDTGGDQVDTDELEPVAGASTVDPEALRYAPQPPKRFAWLRSVLGLLLLLGLLVGGGLLGYQWSQSQYFVAVADDKVAIYRGVQADLPFLDDNEVAETTEVTMASLPEYRAAQVRDGIPADDRDDARSIVEEITGLARVCPEPDPAEPTGPAEPTQQPEVAPPDCIADPEEGS